MVIREAPEMQLHQHAVQLCGSHKDICSMRDNKRICFISERVSDKSIQVLWALSMANIFWSSCPSMSSKFS